MATGDLIIEKFVAFPTSCDKSDNSDDKEEGKTGVVVFDTGFATGNFHFNAIVIAVENFFGQEGGEDAGSTVNYLVVARIAEDIPNSIEVEINAGNHRGAKEQREGDLQTDGGIEAEKFDDIWDEWQNDGDKIAPDFWPGDRINEMSDSEADAKEGDDDF